MKGTCLKSWSAWIWIATLSVLTLSTILTSCARMFSPPRQGWNKSYGPVVPHDKFPADCAICHEGSTWTTIRKDFTFDHEARTGVPLKGAHAKVACLMCHNDRGPVAAFAAQGCSGCHTDPHHTQLGKTCSDCHQEQSWVPVAQIEKHNRTRFPLVGAHAAAACFTCHPGAQVGNFKGAYASCATCHQADLARATSPDHIAQNWISDCQRCHTPTGWKPALFKHAAAFPLTGGHAGIACTDCHKGGVYTRLPTDCANCHLSNFLNTSNPNHISSGFSTNCASCHSTTSWLNAKFNHPAAFPLTAGHAGRSCFDCHKGGVFTGLSTDCVSCHLSNYQKTTNPNHVTMGFGTDCKSCHTTTRWQGAKFSHPAAFPLTLGHAGRSCMDCHKGGVYTGLSTSCVSCHLGNFQTTTNPNHTTIGFGTDCKSCHTTAKWQGAKFTHPAAFPLTLGHAGRSCTDCHKGGVYTGLSTTCVSCHLSNFQATSNPNHTTAGFGTNCVSCHTTAQWQGAKFTHTSAFPLTFGHAGRSCADCHKGGVFTGLTTDCVSCHLSNFQATSNPNHTTAGFGTACATCHTTKTWLGAVFNHTAFPITSGVHKLACTDCHTNSANYQVFTCTACHAHTQATMNSKHREVRGYVWASPSCFQCHPRGRAGD